MTKSEFLHIFYHVFLFLKCKSQSEGRLQRLCKIQLLAIYGFCVTDIAVTNNWEIFAALPRDMCVVCTYV